MSDFNLLIDDIDGCLYLLKIGTALKMSDYIMNPIKKRSKCQNFLRVWQKR